MGRQKFNILVILFLVITPFISAADFNHVISNSEDWHDVYSTMHYANLEKADSDFLTSSNHAKILSEGISKEKDLMIISSEEVPYLFNYPDLLKAEGFDNPQEIEVKNANLELIEELNEINNFIIIDDSFGYNAIAVVPYAVLTNSWIFLSNSINIDRIDNIISERNVENVLIYGYVDREVRDILEKYNPTIINNGDKFEDNIDITKEYLKIKSTKQVLLTNGEFIEKELMSGKQPILFTGRENVPDQIRDYLKNSEIEIGVLIGNELMGAATNIRRSTGISVMVKFARGSRSQTSGVSAVEGLDLFPLPTPTLELTIEEIKYNKLTNNLEITYKSDSNVPVYFKGTITLEDGSENSKVGDIETVFISPGSYKTLTYPIEISNLENLKANVFTLFGETKSSLERILDEEFDVEVVEVLDNCEIDIKDIKYNKQSKEFIIEIKNVQEINCWASLELIDLNIGYDEVTIGTETAHKILEKGARKIKIEQELLQKDLENNNYINLIVHYGEKETSLIKVLNGQFELKIQTITTMTYIIILLTLIILSLIVWFILKRRKEKDNDEI